MAIASTGPLSLAALAAEFGGTGPLRLSDFYRGAGRVPAVGTPNVGIPASGALSLADFRGGAKSTSVTYEVIGAGAAGGFGVDDGTSSGRGADGGASSISGIGISTINAPGGIGGLNGQAPRSGNNGAASAYGPGGVGGGLNAAGSAAPAASRGAGGGGGGGDNGGTYDSGGAGGYGGGAGTRKAATITVDYGTLVAVVIGLKGAAIASGYRGGNGADGYAKLTWDGKSQAFTATGTQTIN